MSNRIPWLLEPGLLDRNVARSIALAISGSLVLTLSAKMQVPFWPVPMTLQSLAVLVIASALGARLAMATVGLYLLQGAAGLPVFAGATAGLSYMLGPTGGFLLGFLLSAMLAGWLSDRGWSKGFLPAAMMMSLGHGVIFAVGLAWLATLMSPAAAMAAGLTPFIAGTIVKIGLGAAIVRLGYRIIVNLRSGQR